MEYFEVPCMIIQGLCSDRECPCPETVIPRGTGYLYISKELVDFRQDALTLKDLERKIGLLRQRFGGLVTIGPGVAAPILVCEQGAKLRKLDLEIASLDAKIWWEKGLVPLRTTPLAGSSESRKERIRLGMEQPTMDDIHVFLDQTVSKDNQKNRMKDNNSHKCIMLNQEGIELYKKGNYNQALNYFEKALQEAKNTFGMKHQQYAIILNNFGELYSSIGEYRKAEKFFIHAKEIIENISGKDDPYFASILNNFGELYSSIGEYRKAEDLFIQSKGIKEKIYGKDHPDYASILNNLAGLYREIGEYDKSESLYIQANKLLEKVSGKNHPDFASNLNNIAALYTSMGKYEKAEVLYIQANEIREKVLGKDHPDFASSLINLAALYRAMGKYEKAEVLYIQSAEIIERVLGKDHPDLAKNFNNLGMLYKVMGEYKKAEALYIQSKDLREKIFGKDHTYYATSLNNLAGLYASISEYEKAEILYVQAKEIRERALGQDHPDCATSLNNLGWLYFLKGEYGKAEILYVQAKEIRERVLGQDHPEFAASLNNLAGIYRLIQEYPKAEALYIQATKISERILGKGHPMFASFLDGLASMYILMREYEEAETLCIQSKEIKERALGKDHPEFAISLNNLAYLYDLKGEYGKAESLYVQSKEIRERALGKDHPELAGSLNNIAMLYKSTGQYEKAETLFVQSLKIREKVLGKDHPDYAQSIDNLASLEILTGRHKDALEKMLEVSRINDRMITQMFCIGDEKRIQEYIRTFQWGYFALLSNFSQHYSELKQHTPSVLDVVLRRKAINMEIAAIRRDNILSGNNPELKDRFDELRYTRIALSNLIMEGPGKIPAEQYQRNIHALEQKIENLEKELAAQVPETELQKKLENASHKAVASLLPENTKLVEFVWYRPVDFKQMKYLSPHYLAFVLSKQENIEITDLGEAAQIDKLIAQYRVEIISGSGRDIKVTAKIKADRSVTQLVSPGQLLYEKLFKPVTKLLGDNKKLLISPDGNITLLPFEILPQPNGRFVIEDFDINYADSGRDLIRFQYCPLPQSKPLIVSDPDFDLAGSVKSSENQSKGGAKIIQFPGTKRIQTEEPSINNRYGLEKIIKDKSRGGAFYFPRLEGTKQEGEIVKDLIGDDAAICSQSFALDEKLKQICGPKVLHIATHGFFIPKSEEEEAEFQKSLRLINRFGENELFKGKRFENPLLRSGLALAGANTFMQGKEPAPHAEDGILTALDVTGMDLRGTDIVVLSACETGLGDVLFGEGVYGLRRAFTLAGARTILSSLWKVPDEETKELMVSFYTKILNGREKAPALRESQREMIHKQRKEGKSDSPFYWGAFVCVGDPGKFGEAVQHKTETKPEKSPGFFRRLFGI